MKTQKEMCDQAIDSYHDKLKTFNEIMTGPNPLTKEEIKKLYEKRPVQYAFLKKWL